ncbi:MAG: PA2778 family cysteine peptidase [Desulfosarcina sp.]|nr:PA2778 family cysteine peptidase [Desulfobacterales bacterium]
MPATANRPDRSRIESVPFFPQEDYQCGPAALAMLLSWSGAQVPPQVLVHQVYTPYRQGSLQPGIISAARRHGRLAFVLKGPEALLTELTAGHPVMVLQNRGLSWHPIWHYAVAVGYDRRDLRMLLHSGRSAYRPVQWSRFLHTWKRSNYWGLVVLSPGTLPASANEGSYFESVLGLEEAGQWQGAVVAYAAALNRWPANLTALIGMANGHIALDDFASAEGALREAVRSHPQSGDAANNLAHVLVLRDKPGEALPWALRAVAIGGPHREIYRQTLREIEAMR